MVKIKKREQLDSDVQLNLFASIPQSYQIEEIKKDESINKTEVIQINEINGLTYVRNFISQSEHDFLVEKIDSQPWLSDLKRRVQHYGYKYDYAKHQINKSMYIAPLPDWALEVVGKLHKSYSLTSLDQIIVNEYEPGQGIANHTDCRTCFEDTIISLSLVSACVMDFMNPKLGLEKSILLEPRSLIVLQKGARYDWTHGIAKRKTDKWESLIIKRTRRVSLTFRTVILPD